MYITYGKCGGMQVQCKCRVNVYQCSWRVHGEDRKECGDEVLRFGLQIIDYIFEMFLSV